MAVITTSLLAPATTASSATTLAVDAGTTVLVGIYAASSGALPDGAILTAQVSTPGVSNSDFQFTDTVRQKHFTGPCSLVLDRNAYSGLAFGFFKSV